ncbi:hypothetical protein [Rugamonas apoptosis]|uniref:Uncharacterized protein n=1 Tax=Rugamonas apoptosis TaxID=2758570 RepID=A0A7W2FE38_9BURK|nr:hypothetical protein [Rugamonas apoptosis]MBA5689939.1 hypothetical protein [Rugamonas apoptosis]
MNLNVARLRRGEFVLKPMSVASNLHQAVPLGWAALDDSGFERSQSDPSTLSGRQVATTQMWIYIHLAEASSCRKIIECGTQFVKIEYPINDRNKKRRAVKRAKACGGSGQRSDRGARFRERTLPMQLAGPALQC